MKTILFLSLVFGCNLIANAHQTVKSSDIDNLHFGDSIHYDLVDASKISAINLIGSLWDFSNIKYLGQEKEVCFIGDMEGHVKFIINYFNFIDWKILQKMMFTMNRNLLFTSLMLCCSVMAISQQAKHSCFTNNLDADALRRMIDKLLRLNTNSHLIFK